MTSPKNRTVALLGNPNCGKTTLFNRLTGLRQKVGNYPGVTVERREGRLAGSTGITLLDLPGCYSLTPKSPDERIARDVLLNWIPDLPAVDAVIVVVDASNLRRNLFLATQVIELGLPVVLVCNMLDLVASHGKQIDLVALGDRLGVPIVGTVATTGAGLDELCTVITRCCTSASPASLSSSGSACSSGAAGFSFADDALLSVTAPLRDALVAHQIVPADIACPVARMLASSPSSDSDVSPDHWPAEFTLAFARIQKQWRSNGEHPSSALVQARYVALQQITGGVVDHEPTSFISRSDRIDAIVTHKFWGMAAFTTVMLVMFLAIFSGADPIMGFIESGVSWLGGFTASVLGEGVLTDLLVDGVIAGVGNIVVFFPQICILFLFIALLEDTGYMARVAFLMDRVMSGAGLHGKSFIPLLSSFACAVPAIMATRTIENRRDRLATMLVAPLMSCSARLPVYIILITILFPGALWLKVGIMLSMYALGTITALAVAFILKRTLLKGPTPTFIMELPPYRMPMPGALIRNMWDRSKLFLTQAGTVILALSIVLWALAYFPRVDAKAGLSPGAQLRQSYMGQIGRGMEPIIEPLGFDWKIGVGLAASFAAREVFVSTMGIVYGIEGDVDESSTTLIDAMSNARRDDGRKVFTPLTGISLMVFYVLACQCMSTIAVVKRETNSWRWPTFMFAYMTVLAYVASLIVYQGGLAVGFR